MVLHEYYFANLASGSKLSPGSDLAVDLGAAWGSVGAWREDFAKTGGMRGVGWAILYRDPATGGLFNWWVSSHEQGHPAGFNPVLVLDVFEHAFMVDHGAGGRDDVHRGLPRERQLGGRGAAPQGQQSRALHGPLLREDIHMKSGVLIIAIVLIAIGVVSLAYQGITYTTREKIIDLGPIKATADKEKTIPLPPILGGLALAGGVVLLVVGARR